ncbi:MAG: DUF5054 domain-containing protein [Niameybacter sp.]
MKEIIVLFKTHLDVGFTDFARVVVDNYITSYIPKAIEVARQLSGKDECFIWTTGSWIIEEFLRQSDNKELMIEAIKEGNIRWHGLPFTTHTELMSKELFCHGLGISTKLDKQFNMKTTAAKMTDVPGHTKAIISYMAQAGIKFLHLGVNPASRRPDVPALFKWRADTGEEIVVMYNDDYGDFTPIPTTDVGIYFGHTGDNLGPQSAEAIEEIYAQLREKYPHTKLRAGTLEDVAEIVLKIKDLPILTSEIGDTWIHGTGCDPKKISQYRALLNLKSELAPADMDLIYEGLLPIPEHTWGLDEKTHLGEHAYFIRSEFEKVRGTEKFQKMEKSWQEQRSYIGKAVNGLTGEVKKRAEQAISEYKRTPLNLSEYTKLEHREDIEITEYRISFNENGAICHLTYKDEILADKEHIWGSVLYEVFSLNEYERFTNQYMTHPYDWALEDFGKIGMDKAIDAYGCTYPELEDIYQKDNELVCVMSMSGTATQLYGAPEKLALNIMFLPNMIKMDLAWWGKKASRVAEALWFAIHPLGEIKSISKLSRPIDPRDVVENGNRRLHATDWGIKYGTCTIECIDSALVNVGKPSLLNFINDKINPSE